MTWELASTAVLALVLAAGFAWYERRRPPARIVALVAALAALAVVGRLAFAAVPNVKPTTDIVLFAGFALGAVPGLRRGRDHRAGVEHLPRPGTVDRVADGGVGRGRRGGRGPGQGLRRPGARARAAGDRVRARRPGLRRAARRLPVHPRRPAGPADLPGGVRHLAAVQPGPCDRQRRVLPADRPGLHPRAAALPAPVRGALAAGGGGRHAGAGAGAWRRAGRPSGRRRPPRRPRRPRATSSACRTATAASAPRRASARASCSPAGPRSGWPSARRNPRDVARKGGQSRSPPTCARAGRSPTSASWSARSWCSRPRGSPPRRYRGRNLVADLLRRQRARRLVARQPGAHRVRDPRAARRRASRRGVGLGAARRANYLERGQNPDGGFGFVASAESDVDDTGAALQALAAAGRARGAAARQGGRLPARRAEPRRRLRPDGGQGRRTPSRPPGRCRGWWRWASGRLGGRRTRSATSTGLQRRDGHIRYSRTSDQTPVWVTAQALTALRRKPFPLATVPRKKRREEEAREEGGRGSGQAQGEGGRAGTGARRGRGASAPAAQEPGSVTVKTAAERGRAGRRHVRRADRGRRRRRARAGAAGAAPPAPPPLSG